MSSLQTTPTLSNEIRRARCWCVACHQECEPEMFAGDPVEGDVEWRSSCCMAPLCDTRPGPVGPQCNCRGIAWLDLDHHCPRHGSGVTMR